jgi:hypothetical protein
MPVAESTKSTGGRGTAYHSQIRVRFISKKGKAGKIEAVDGDETDESSDEKGAKSSAYDTGTYAGVHLFYEIDKNRVGPPFKKGVMDFIFNRDGKPSLDYYSGYMDYLISEGIVDSTTTKGKIIYKGDKYSKRGDDFSRLLEEHPELVRKGEDE